jgi:ATP-dependent DNA helicase RecG
MESQRIEYILQKGEGLTIEFKRAASALPNNLFETVCAFLNRNGGTILLGITDEGEVCGVDENKIEQICKNLTNLSNNSSKLDPVFLLQPSIVSLGSKKIIHVFVPSSSQVHKTNGKCYDRGMDGDFVVTTHAKISELYMRKSANYSENTIYPFLNETHFEEGIVQKAKNSIRSNRPAHPWLELIGLDFYKAAGLYRTDLMSNLEGFTLAALLLFGKEEVITSMLPHYKIDALVRRIDKDRYDDRETLRCNLITAYELLMRFVAKHLPDKFHLEGDQRISLRENIFREVIANFLIHREYINPRVATFEILADNCIVKNANKPHLFGAIEPNNYEPYPKNPHIAKFFVQMARAEELGTGIRNVYRYSKLYSGQFPLFKEEDLFEAVIPLLEEKTTSKTISKKTIKTTTKKTPITPDKSTKSAVKTLSKTTTNTSSNTTTKSTSKTTTKTKKKTTTKTTSKRKVEILVLIRENPSITVKEISRVLRISVEGVRYHLKNLKKDKKIQFFGAAKTGHWEMTPPAPTKITNT